MHSKINLDNCKRLAICIAGCLKGAIPQNFLKFRELILAQPGDDFFHWRVNSVE